MYHLGLQRTFDRRLTENNMNWTGLIILLVILAAPFAWAVSIYNGLLALRNRFNNGRLQAMPYAA